MTDGGVPAMSSIFNALCVLVTAAFVLTFVPGLRLRERSLLSVRDRGTALCVFLLLGLVEELSDSHSGWLNERIVTACAAGLVAGPWVGMVVSVFVTWLAVSHDGLPVGSIGISMLCGGLAGGWLYRRRPRLAEHPITGFWLTVIVSWVRGGVKMLCVFGGPAGPRVFGQMGIGAGLQGVGTTLMLGNRAAGG